MCGENSSLASFFGPAADTAGAGLQGGDPFGGFSGGFAQGGQNAVLASSGVPNAFPSSSAGVPAVTGAGGYDYGSQAITPGNAIDTLPAGYTPGGGATPSVPVAPAPSPIAGATAQSVAPVSPDTTAADIQTAIGNQPPDTLGQGQNIAAPKAGSGTGIFDFLSKNVLGPAKEIAPLASLGAGAYGLINQIARPGGVEALSPLQQQQLNMLQQNQQTAQQYIQGNVPDSQAQTIQSGVGAQVNNIKAKYAQMGMTGSTAESQDIAAAQQQGQVQLAQAQQAMIRTGAAMLGLPVNQIGQLTAQQMAQDESFSNALASFAGALSGNPPQQPKAA